MPVHLLVVARLALPLLAAAFAGAAGAAADDVTTLDQGLVQVVPQATNAPPEGGDWRPVHLPDDWLQANDSAAPSGAPQVVWYRLEFDTPPPSEANGEGRLLAVYFPRACSTLEVYLNGQLLHRGGRLIEPVTRSCYRPQWVALPAGALQARGNRLDVQVAGYALPRVAARQRAGGLAAPRIGPQQELRQRYDRQLFWNVTAAQIVAALLALAGVVMLVLAWLRRLGHFAYLGIAALGWAAFNARLWQGDLLPGNDPVELVSAIACVPLSVCGVMFLLRYGQVRRRALDVVLWSQCVLLPALLVIAAPERLFMAATVCYAVLALELALAVGWLIGQAWRGDRGREFKVLTAIAAAALVIVVAEVGVQLGLLPMPPSYLLQVAITLLVLASAVWLVQALSETMGQAEGARQQLERRIAEMSGQVERNFAHLAEVRVEQVAEKERKRIAADLHDDLGAKLLTIVHTSADERISTLAREALEEMRLSVRGIAGKPVHLADALADWRAETVQRLGDAGIEVEWQGADHATPRTLPARAYVQTTRVLREATSNLIKHSGASRALISCAIDEDFRLVIRDNGRGIPLELDGKLDRGHGMASMKHRAKQMHGQCLVESGPGYGTVIRLTLPL